MTAGLMVMALQRLWTVNELAYSIDRLSPLTSLGVMLRNAWEFCAPPAALARGQLGVAENNHVRARHTLSGFKAKFHGITITAHTR